MKRILCLLILVAAPVAALAQAAGPAQPSPPGITMAEAGWAREYMTPVTGFDIAPPLTGTVSRGPAVHPTVNNNLPANRARYTPGMPSDEHFRTGSDGSLFRRASVELTNTGASAIKSVRMDFVFTDPATGTEVLRIRHRSKKRLKPGKNYVYSKTVKNSKQNRRGDGARMGVELREIVYTGGSVWKP